MSESLLVKWNKMKKILGNKLIYIILGSFLFPLIIGIILKLIPFPETKKSVTFTKDITQTMVDSPNGFQVAGDIVTTVINNKQMQLPLKFETSITFLRTVNKKLFNVLYNLPNDKKAFISKVERGQKYILFYTNEDFSEIYVPEKYKATSGMLEDACWIVTLVCRKNTCGNYMELGPKAQGIDSRLCYEY